MNGHSVGITISNPPRPGDPPDPLPDPDPRNCRSVVEIVGYDPTKPELDFNGCVTIALAANGGPQFKPEVVPIQYGEIKFAFDQCRAVIRERYGVEVRESECPKVGELRCAPLASDKIDTTDARLRPPIFGEVTITRNRQTEEYKRFLAAHGQTDRFK